MAATSRESGQQGSTAPGVEVPDLEVLARPGPAALQPGSLGQLVADFHQRVHGLLGPGYQPAGDQEVVPADTRRAVRLDSAVAAMTAHLHAAESTMIPAAARALGREAAAPHRARVRDMYRVMRRIEQHVWGDSRAGAANLDRLRASLERMVDSYVDDEQALAERLDARLSTDDRDALVERFENARLHAPTRPHPNAVQTPLVRLAMGAVARWDRMLDTMDARVVPGRPVARTRARLGRWGEYLAGTPTWQQDEPLDQEHGQAGRQTERRGGPGPR